MRWVRLALVSEGSSDDEFLAGVLQRSAQWACPPGTEVGDVLVVRAAPGPAPVAGVVAALEREQGAFTLVAVHHDGGSDPDRARRLAVEPIERAWRGAGHPDPIVAVVPVRETEAWALADPAPLRRMLGMREQEQVPGLPGTARELEGEQDPKGVLRALFEREQRSGWDSAYLRLLGELVSLERLRELPSFRRWENDLAEALRVLPGFREG